MIFGTREALAKIFGIGDPLQIVFTKNATEALNISILGLLNTEDHVITSSMEHNSVMRPIRAMEAKGLEVSVIPCSERGEMDPQDILPYIKKKTPEPFS